MKKWLSLFLVPAASFGIDSTFLDKTVDPCVDFYQYACGSWLKRTSLPSDRGKWTLGFSALDEKNQNLLIGILEGYGKGSSTPASPYARELSDTYAACMDEAQVEKSANSDFRVLAEPVLAMKSLKELPKVLADLHLKSVNAVFEAVPEEDLKNPSEKLLGIDQGGMGLPSREYYVSDSKEMAALREAYVAFAETALVKVGFSSADAKKKAGAVLTLEKRLAIASLLPVERRDPNKMYHRLERKGLIGLAPGFGWTEYFAALGIPTNDKINVAVPDFIKALDGTLAETPFDDLKAYLVVRLFATSVGAMDKDSLQSYFAFVSKLYGIGALPSRPKQCLAEVSSNLRFALGKVFVDVSFGPEAKRDALEMVSRLKQEMRAALGNATWMDKKTRALALRKLEMQLVFMGHPDRWQQYRGLKVTPRSMLANRMAASTYNRKYQLKKIGKPVDRAEWNNSPTDVNAYILFSQNLLQFPAAILQPPNFGPKQSDAENYGAMGTIVGHEITHAYDDMGKQFDERGAVKEWWTPKTGEEFDRRAACIVKQFDEYVVDGDLHVNGKLVQGEAIGDLGGMKLALAALKKKLGKTTPPLSSGFTVDQVFFLSLAQAWCTKSSVAFERFQTNTDPHPLDRFRVNGTVRNVPEFAAAFSCPVGAPLAPTERCVVW